MKKVLFIVLFFSIQVLGMLLHTGDGTIILMLHVMKMGMEEVNVFRI